MLKISSRPFLLPEFPVVENAINLFRVAVEGLVRDLNTCPYLTGAHVTDIELSAGSNSVSHKLGRIPTGWIVTRIQTGTCTAYETARDTKAVTLSSSGSSKVDIWFF